MQCKSKLAGLKNTYKNIKDHNTKSGSSRQAWRYLDIMDEMFTKKPWVKPLLTLDSGSSAIASSDDEIKDIGCGTRKSSSLPSENKPPKRKKYNTLEKMIEHNAATRQKMHEEAMSRQDKLLDILQKFLQQ
ncbi:uncharacterized protein LOC143894765 [Temnothorax americanus]|uniref:uncharacterized protein LOC143894765 n=1 Tax=Temnothorax americanus TaxID=1964332 RepID=UPI004068FD15